ncbi:MAG: hypothetical protein K8U03_16820 [Planctomycetia bacterium]|nr:hypothetical protein [Planctomycetia bacterium]
MRDKLLGYLLRALEPDEERELERRLSIDPELRRDLELLRRSLEPIDGTTASYDPPEGLAKRTCEWISGLADVVEKNSSRYEEAVPSEDAASLMSLRKRYEASQPVDLTAPPARRWGWADATVTAGIVVAASLLFFPALASMRYQSRVVACRDKLHRVGMALIDYSRTHGDLFPEVPHSGPLAHAGVYAPRLQQARLLMDASDVVCPGQARACAQFENIPTLDELEHADSAALDKLTAKMGGSYGYALGYVEDGSYHFVRNQSRPHFALLADAPQDHALGSLNHGCGGQNVFFEDGHALFLNCCRRRDLGDDLFSNHSGFVGAGIGPNDVVIAPSAAAPLLAPHKTVR